MNKPFENTFDVKFDEKAIKTFKDLIKEKGIRHFKLESDLYGVLDVVLYEEYQKIEQQLDKYKNVIDKIKEKIKEDNEYLENAKEMYSQHDDELVKAATLQLINNNLVQNDDILELLEEVE